MSIVKIAVKKNTLGQINELIRDFQKGNTFDALLNFVSVHDTPWQPDCNSEGGVWTYSVYLGRKIGGPIAKVYSSHSRAGYQKVWVDKEEMEALKIGL